MRVAVVGVGGLGGFFGGALARAGWEVVFVARGANLEALRTRGLQVRSHLLGDFELPVAATDDPAEVGPVDFILFCVKTYDLDAAAEAMRPLVGPRTMILPLQNGVEGAVRLGRYVPPQQVLGGVSYVSSTLEAPGVVAQRAGEKLLFGELAGGSSPRTERLWEVFRQAGLAAELRPSIRVDLWEKCIIVCASSPLSALTRLPIGAILASPPTAALCRGLMEEAAAVGRAVRVPISDDAVERLFGLLAGFEPSARASMYHDLEAGRRLELEHLNGALLRLAAERDILTPLNFAVYAALAPYADGRATGLEAEIPGRSSWAQRPETRDPRLR